MNEDESRLRALLGEEDGRPEEFVWRQRLFAQSRRTAVLWPGRGAKMDDSAAGSGRFEADASK